MIGGSRIIAGWLVALGVLGLSTAACGPESIATSGRNATGHGDKPYVVLVSFDGFRHDYRERFETPNLDRLVAAGVEARGFRSVFPTLTFPAHYSIVTGLHPGHHGITNNKFWDPVRQARYSPDDRSTVADGSWYDGEPIWVTAEKQGLLSASYFWVGSEAAIGGVRASEVVPFRRGVPDDARVDTVIEWLARPQASRPHAILLYFSAVDGAGHRHGPDADGPLQQAVSRVDRALGRLVDGIDALPHGERVHVIVVSDHGMATIDRERTMYLSDALELRKTRVASTGPTAHLFVEGDATRRREVRADLERAFPEAEVYLRAELPAAYHAADNPRFGDVIVVAPEGAVVLLGSGMQSTRGRHGYPASMDSMLGLFAASGPRFRAGTRLPVVSAVDVYPLLCQILGLEPAPHDGSLEPFRPALVDPNAGP